MLRNTLLFLLLLFFSTVLLSQDKLEYQFFRNEVKVDVFPLLNNTLGVAYEHYIREANSVQGKVSFVLKESNYENILGNKIEGQYRFYAYSEDPPIGMYFSGLFFAPFLQWEYLNYTRYPHDVVDRRNYYFMSLRGGFVAGLEFFLYDRFVFEMSLGGGIKYTVDQSSNAFDDFNDNITRPAYNGIVPKAHALMGIRF